MAENKICVNSPVKAVVDLDHNRNPFSPRFNIPNGTCGIVKEVRTGQRTKDGLLFYVCWSTNGHQLSYCCTSSEIALVPE